MQRSRTASPASLKAISGPRRLPGGHGGQRTRHAGAPASVVCGRGLCPWHRAWRGRLPGRA
jgi:hypothetical protein